MPNPDANLRETIARIDERTLALLKSHDDLKDTLSNHIDHIYEDMEKNYTKRADFDPVRKLVFGFVGFMLLSIGGMFIGLIVKSNTSAHESTPAIHMPHIPESVRPPNVPESLIR